MNDPKTSPAQLRATMKYRKKLNRISVDFSPVDSDLWAHLCSQPNKQGYIKALIRADFQRCSD